MLLYCQPGYLISDPSVYIKTDQIDGETDLKLRKPFYGSDECFKNKGVFFESDVEFEVGLSEIKLDDFDGFIHLIDKFSREISAKEPLSVENTIWSGCSINKSEIHGLVIAVGLETRLIKNSKNVKRKKISDLDKKVNVFSVILFLMMLVISIFNAIMQGQYKFGVASFLISVCRFIILLSFLIPISLKLYLLIARFGYGHQISEDKEIEGTSVKNETIVDELGKIEVILSDKTGTITQNIMFMDKISIGEFKYPKDRFKRLVSDFYSDSEDSNNEEKQKAVDMAFSFVICNNVSLKVNEGERFFDASSPDEIAMVEFFEETGFKITERNDSRIVFTDLNDSESRFEILEVFPFESARKRMGIIVEKFIDNQSHGIYLYVKGADSVMKKKVASQDDALLVEENALSLAKEGLRTLVFTSKELTSDQLETFRNTHKENLIKGNKHLNEPLLQSLEENMTYLGITAVKDLLQDDVVSSFAYLEQARLKLWILTGDKLETAKHICLSTGLAKRSRPVRVLSLDDEAALVDFAGPSLHRSDDTQVVLMVDCNNFASALETKTKLFLQACLRFDYVCFARCTPAQKSDIATGLKSKLNKRVLAVGDGGNDVGMIQIANVGVGIYGREGNQAALAADFTINKFSYLCKLVLFHGRNAHMGISSISQFVLHRGLIISWIQEIFSALFFMISMPVFNGMMVMLYSAVFTVLPALSVVYDFDVSWEQLKDYLGSYKESGGGVSTKNFLIWCFISFYQAGAIFISALYLFDNYLSNFVGITFTALILAETFNIIFLISKCSKPLLASILATLFLYIICVFIFPSDFDINIFDLDFLVKVSLVFIITWVPVFVVQMILKHFYNNVGDLVG